MEKKGSELTLLTIKSSLFLCNSVCAIWFSNTCFFFIFKSNVRYLSVVYWFGLKCTFISLVSRFG